MPVLTASTPEKNSDDPLITGFPNLVTWFRSHGGVIDGRITIGYEPGSAIRGMIATAPIPSGTILIQTPGNLVLSVPSDNQCKMIKEIIKEISIGTQSKWYEYFRFDDSSGSRVPTQWDKSSRAVNELQGLPPTGNTHNHIEWYTSNCMGGVEVDELNMKALMMFLSRAADIGLIPMYDLMNHHNGKINTELVRTSDRGLNVVASADIAANSPIYNTYARGGMESSVDVFNTYGFIEDYPQLWRWDSDELVQLLKEDKDHAQRRYGLSNSDANLEPSDRLHIEPNTNHYEVLVISPTLAALFPTKQLVKILGNGQQSLEDWQTQINVHHANLRSSHVNALHDSALAILNEVPTTIEQDTKLLSDENRRLENEKKMGRIDQNKGDAIQAIEFRLVFKKGLQLAVDVAEREKFLVDTEEL